MDKLSSPEEMVSMIETNMGTTEFDELRKQWITRTYTDLKVIWGATSISPNAFARCTSLKEAIIPPTVKTIGENCFDGCSNLTRCVVPEGVESICGTVVNCPAITSFEMPEGLVSIGGWTLNQGKITKLIIPSTVTTIAEYAFIFTSTTPQIYFKGTPKTLASNSLLLKKGGDIYVPWAEGEVTNAPWGSPDATIHYNYIYAGE